MGCVGGSSWRDQHKDLKLAETEQDTVRKMKAQTVSQIAHHKTQQRAQQRAQQTQGLCCPKLQNLNLQNDQQTQRQLVVRGPVQTRLMVFWWMGSVLRQEDGRKGLATGQSQRWQKHVQFQEREKTVHENGHDGRCRHDQKTSQDNNNLDDMSYTLETHMEQNKSLTYEHYMGEEKENIDIKKCAGNYNKVPMNQQELKAIMLSRTTSND